MKKYTLDIDHELCWGCRTCEVACKQETRTPDGLQIIRVSEAWPRTEQGGVDFVFHVHVCQHCDDPPCAEVCPEEAITKRDDNIVLLDDARCSGCGLCIDACPYEAISFDSANKVTKYEEATSEARIRSYKDWYAATKALNKAAIPLLLLSSCVVGLFVMLSFTGKALYYIGMNYRKAEKIARCFVCLMHVDSTLFEHH